MKRIISALACLLAATLPAAGQTAVNGGGGDSQQAADASIAARLADPSVQFAFTPGGARDGQTAFIPAQGGVQKPGALGLPDGTTVHFALSDLPLTAGQIAGWDATLAAIAGNLLQFPAYGIPVVLPYAAPRVTLTRNPVTKAYGLPVAASVPYTRVILRDADLCGIFSGLLTDWSAITGTPAFSAASKLQGAIAVVVRADSAGTTLWLTQHLAAVCTAADTAPGVTFTATDSFPCLFPGGLPANFTAVTGAPAVAAAVMAGGSGIGYTTPDYTAIAPAAAAATALPVAKVLNQHSGRVFPPTMGAVNLALKSPGPTDLNVTAPATAADAADQTKWIPQIANPADGYPIVGYTTIDVAQCYSDPVVYTGLLAWLDALYATADTTLRTNGFSRGNLAETKMLKSVLLAPNNSDGLKATPWQLNINSMTACANTGSTTVPANAAGKPGL